MQFRAQLRSPKSTLETALSPSNRVFFVVRPCPSALICAHSALICAQFEPFAREQNPLQLPWLRGFGVKRPATHAQKVTVWSNVQCRHQRRSMFPAFPQLRTPNSALRTCCLTPDSRLQGTWWGTQYAGAGSTQLSTVLGIRGVRGHQPAQHKWQKLPLNKSVRPTSAFISVRSVFPLPYLVLVVVLVLVFDSFPPPIPAP